MAKNKVAAKSKEVAKPKDTKAKDPSKKKGPKLDTTQLKQFLINKGERIGLFVAAGLMAFLLISGLWMGLGTRSNHLMVKQSAKGLLDKVNSTSKSDATPGGDGQAKKPA